MKRLLCLSDIHPGSTDGLLPPNFNSEDGRLVGQNIGQKYTWECWQHMIEWAAAKKPDGIVINGDVVEGKQFKGHGGELCLPRVIDQEQASIEILTPLFSACKPKKVYFVKGTFYHDDEMGRSVDNIAHHFKTEKYEGLGIGRYAREVLDLNVEGVLCDFSHGISVSGGLYRAVALDREMLWATLAEKMNQTPRADVIVRAHAHYFVHIEHSAKHGVILPAWQLQTSFMRKHSRYRMIPDLGAAMIEIDGEAKKRGEDPCRIEKKLYALPPHRIAHF